MFRITCDARSRLVRLQLSGFWDTEEAKAFTRDQQKAVRSLGPPFGTHLTLADVSSFAVQTREVSDIIRDLVLNAVSTSRRIALVGGDGLARLQFKRIAQREDMQLFASIEEAEAWLTKAP